MSTDTWAPEDRDPRRDAIDVVVTDPAGRRWAATFLTPSYMAQRRAADQASGECLAGAYFWIARPIFTDELSRPMIADIVADLVASGELQTAFRRLPGALPSPAP